MIRAAIAAMLVLALAGCATIPDTPPHPEAAVYAVTPDAMADVNAALARAAAANKRVLLVMGANWCHDSRALAGWLESPRFAELVSARYEVVYVDVGVPQTGEGRNLEIAQRFGLAELPGTPALLVLTAEGKAVNLDTAASWRNAASRSEDAIFDELYSLSGAIPALNSSAQVSSPSQSAGDLVMWVAGDRNDCRFGLTPDGPWVSSLSELSPIKDSTSAVHVRTDKNTAWACVAKGVYELQKYGHNIHFVSDPAS